ncbi:MAG TPA: type IV pilin protein [Roseateles sp.]
MSPTVSPRLHRGFTMIELMIVVAIVGILAAVAVPQYKDYVRRGSLPEAFSQLADYRVKMEQYYQDNRNYGTTSCADVTGGPSWSNFTPTSAPNFTYSCSLGSGTSAGQNYTITATGRTGKASAGHVFTIDQSNAQTTTSFKGATVTGKSCWLVKGSEC